MVATQAEASRFRSFCWPLPQTWATLLLSWSSHAPSMPCGAPMRGQFACSPTERTGGVTLTQFPRGVFCDLGQFKLRPTPHCHDVDFCTRSKMAKRRQITINAETEDLFGARGHGGHDWKPADRTREAHPRKAPHLERHACSARLSVAPSSCAPSQFEGRINSPNKGRHSTTLVFQGKHGKVHTTTRNCWWPTSSLPCNHALQCKPPPCAPEMARATPVMGHTRRDEKERERERERKREKEREKEREKRERERESERV